MAWYANLNAVRTSRNVSICLPAITISENRPSKKRYRNPIVYARELQVEMIVGDLSRRQLAEKHNVTPDRITQWLLLLELPEHEQQRIEGLGDHWCRQVVTERSLRYLRREM